MKILIRKSDNVVIYAQNDLMLDSEAHGDGWHDQNFNLANAMLDEAALPENWLGAAYTYLDGTWTCTNPQAVAAMLEAKRKASIPQSISRRQFKQALTRAGKRAMVEAAIAAADQDTKDWYAEATDFQPTHPVIVAMAQALNIPQIDIDSLFILGGSL